MLNEYKSGVIYHRSDTLIIYSPQSNTGYIQHAWFLEADPHYLIPGVGASPR